MRTYLYPHEFDSWAATWPAELRAVIDDTIKRAYREGYDDGYDEGEEEGFARGRAEGFAEGRNAGYDVGYDAGHGEGQDRAKEDRGMAYVTSSPSGKTWWTYRDPTGGRGWCVRRDNAIVLGTFSDANASEIADKLNSGGVVSLSILSLTGDSPRS